MAEDSEVVYIGSELPSEYAGSVYTKKLNGDDGNVERYNIFRGRLLIRHASSGRKYLYDILERKKETGKSCQT